MKKRFYIYPILLLGALAAADTVHDPKGLKPINWDSASLEVTFEGSRAFKLETLELFKSPEGQYRAIVEGVNLSADKMHRVIVFVHLFDSNKEKLGSIAAGIEAAPKKNIDVTLNSNLWSVTGEPKYYTASLTVE